LIAVTAATALSAGTFLPHQSLVSDETTQLAGLALGPVRVVGWLADPHSLDIGQIGDRMPPFSYWAAWAWAQGFGLSEYSLRWFGVLCATLAAGFVYTGTRRAFGSWAACAAGMLFALSPNVCYYAVEIRSYPLFLLTAAGSLDSFLALLVANGHGRRHWVALTSWLALGMFTHFFGLVNAGAVLLALLLVGWGRFDRVWPVFGAGAFLACCGVALLPFVFGAASISSANGPPNFALHRWMEIAQLLYRQLGHPTMVIHPVTVGVALLSAAILLGAGLLVRRETSAPTHGPLLVLAAGLGVTIGASFFLKSFSATKYFYSCWTLPFLFTALGSALATRQARLRALAAFAALFLLGCEVTGTCQLWVRGDYFAHTGYRKIRHVLATLPRAETAVVHERVPGYGFLFFSIQYDQGTDLKQYVATPQGERCFGGNGIDPDRPEELARLNDYQKLVVVNMRQQKAADIARQIIDRDEPLGPGRLLRALESSGAWHRVGQELLSVAFMATEVVVLERSREGPGNCPRPMPGSIAKPSQLGQRTSTGGTRCLPQFRAQRPYPAMFQSHTSPPGSRANKGWAHSSPGWYRRGVATLPLMPFHFVPPSASAALMGRRTTGGEETP
jgi:hypothetical protein